MMLKTVFDLKKSSRKRKQFFTLYPESGVKKKNKKANSYKKGLIDDIKTTSSHDANLFKSETLNSRFLVYRRPADQIVT